MGEPSFASTQPKYRRLWNSARLTRSSQADAAIGKILPNRWRYESVEAKTGVPWYFIAVTHMRESSNNFKGVLHNGEHIIGTGRKTRLVPKGRGPFSSWEEAAIDALRLKGLHKIKDWSLERVLYECERFNGWGYHNKGRVSPYVWAGTNHYVSGKYVADGVYDSGHVDTQLGVAIVLKKLEAKGFRVDPKPNARSEPEPVPPPPDIDGTPPAESPKAEDVETKPAIKSTEILAAILAFLSQIAAFATDWRVFGLVILACIVGYLIWRRHGKPDIRGIL
jgi:lysozyme family protein